MLMDPVGTELAYSYEPADFFEAPTTVALPGGTATFAAGEVVLTLVAPRDMSHEQAAALTDEVRTTLRIRQLLAGRAFSLTSPRITHFDATGRRHLVMLAEAGRFEIRGYPVDFRVTSASGSILRDTKAERIRDETAFLAAVAPKAASAVPLRQMLDSYGRSLEDVPNALVHLYEIRDTAATQLGGDSAARERLNITRADWNALGRLANHEPFAEGRHRGHQIVTRNATPAELDQARAIARAIIESFARIA